MTSRSSFVWTTILLGASLAACGSSSTKTCTDDQGNTHKAGESWDAPDGCNTCACQEDGLSSCTELGCGLPGDSGETGAA